MRQENVKYFCRICKADFGNSLSFIQHFRQIHGQEPVWECYECHQVFSSMFQLREHASKHRVASLTCVCGEIRESKPVLALHQVSCELFQKKHQAKARMKIDKRKQEMEAKRKEKSAERLRRLQMDFAQSTNPSDRESVYVAVERTLDDGTVLPAMTFAAGEMRTHWAMNAAAIVNAPCEICQIADDVEEKPFLFCENTGCELAVHQACYRVKEIPEGQWFCDECEHKRAGGSPVKVTCCDTISRPKFRAGDEWIHAVCLLSEPKRIASWDEDSRKFTLKSDSTGGHACMYCDEVSPHTGRCCTKLEQCTNYVHATCALHEKQEPLVTLDVNGKIVLGFCCMNHFTVKKLKKSRKVDQEHLEDLMLSGEDEDSDKATASTTGTSTSKKPKTKKRKQSAPPPSVRKSETREDTTKAVIDHCLLCGGRTDLVGVIHHNPACQSRVLNETQIEELVAHRRAKRKLKDLVEMDDEQEDVDIMSVEQQEPDGGGGEPQDVHHHLRSDDVVPAMFHKKPIERPVQYEQTMFRWDAPYLAMAYPPPEVEMEIRDEQMRQVTPTLLNVLKRLMAQGSSSQTTTAVLRSMNIDLVDSGEASNTVPALSFSSPPSHSVSLDRPTSGDSLFLARETLSPSVSPPVRRVGRPRSTDEKRPEEPKLNLLYDAFPFVWDLRADPSRKILTCPLVPDTDVTPQLVVERGAKFPYLRFADRIWITLRDAVQHFQLIRGNYNVHSAETFLRSRLVARLVPSQVLRIDQSSFHAAAQLVTRWCWPLGKKRRCLLFMSLDTGTEGL